MSKKNKYQAGLNDFKDYSEGKLRGRKRNQFERYLEQNLFDAEAAEGLSQVTSQEAEDDLMTASRKISGRISRRKRIAWYSAAAAIASILIVSTIFLRIDTTPGDRTESIDKMSEAAEPKPVEVEEKGKNEVIYRYTDDAKDTKREKSESETVPEGRKSNLQRLTKPETEKAVEEPEVQSEIEPAIPKQGKSDALSDEISREETEEDYAFETEAEEYKMDAEAVPEKKQEAVTVAPVGADDEAAASKRMAAPPTSGVRMKAVTAAPDQEVDEVNVVGNVIDVAAKETVAGGISANPAETETYIPAAPGEGMTAYKEYLDKNLVFPAADSAIESGLVVLAFYILPDGRPHTIKVLQSPSQAFSDEATRVLLTGPDWTPASRDGNYADEEVQLRVTFGKEHKR